jgi:monoamine oxidase
VVAAGRSALVLEARDRVGGRVLNHDLGGGRVTEAGAEFVGPTQDHIIGLAKEVGVDLYDSYDTGNGLYVAGGQTLPYSDTTPAGILPPDPTVAADAAAIVAQLDQMATSVPVDAPWTAPSAAAWDQQTFETWLAANSSNNPRFHRVVSSYTRAAWGAEPRDLSLLYIAFYVASSGNETNQGTVERNISTRGGAQNSRMVGGTQQVPIRMARELKSRILLGHPARRISQEGGAVKVVTDSLTVSGRRAVVAMAPSLAGRLVYDPELPELRDQLTQRVPMGALIKVDVVYDRPFWRDQGLSGFVLSDTDPCNIVFDSTPQEGSPGVLLAFVGGDAARAFGARSPADRRAAVIANMVGYFGPAAASPRAYFDTNWDAEPYSRGCPVGVMQPGTLLGYGSALRPPVGAIHWAGTETSTFWNGYMDGAVRSGERAAREVLAEL